MQSDTPLRAVGETNVTKNAYDPNDERFSTEAEVLIVFERSIDTPAYVGGNVNDAVTVVVGFGERAQVLETSVRGGHA